MLLMLFPLSLSAQAAQSIKTVAREQFPSVKSSHLTEAIAAGFDYQSNAALRAALDANRAPGFFALVRFGKRLCELGYERPSDHLADGSSLSWNAQCLYSLMVAAAARKGPVESKASLPIGPSKELMREAGCRKESGSARATVANPAWLRDGPHGRQLALFIDQYGDAIEEIRTVSFQVEEADRISRSGLLHGIGFEEPLSEGLVFSLSDTAMRLTRLALSGWVNYSDADHVDGRITIAPDEFTLARFRVERSIYQERLAHALPDHDLVFVDAAENPMAVGFTYAINAVSGTGTDDPMRLVMDAAKKVWADVLGSRLADIKALDGRTLATLSTEEREVLDFYRNRGRKYGVTVEIVHEDDPGALAGKGREQADQLLSRTNSRVRVVLA